MKELRRDVFTIINIFDKIWKAIKCLEFFRLDRRSNKKSLYKFETFGDGGPVILSLTLYR